MFTLICGERWNAGISTQNKGEERIELQNEYVGLYEEIIQHISTWLMWEMNHSTSLHLFPILQSGGIGQYEL